MYFVLISVILKHFLCIDHRNLVFPRGYSTEATLLANYWSNPGNQVGTYTGTQFGTNGTTCLLRHHTLTQHTPLVIHVIGTDIPKGSHTTAHIKEIWLKVVTHLGMGQAGVGGRWGPTHNPNCWTSTPVETTKLQLGRECI